MQDGTTTLMHAAYHGYQELVKVLLQAGAAVNALDSVVSI